MSDLVDFLKKSGASAGETSALDKIINGSADFTAEVKQQTQADQKAAEEAAKKAYEAKLTSLKPNEKLLSQITGGPLPKSGIDHILITFPDGTFPKEFEVDIPEVDPFYVWDADVLEKMILCIKLQEKGLLVGFPGCGKTTAVKQLAAHRRQPYARFNGKGGIEPASFLGYSWADYEKVMENGQEKIVQVMKFKEGLMPQAVRNGYLVTIDEVFKLTPDINMALQSLYEKGGFLMLDDKPGTIEEKHVKPHPHFTMFCTDNTAGTGDNLELFGASQLQDTSTLDRFGITIRVDYLSVKDETDMLHRQYPGTDRRKVQKAVKFAGLVRRSFQDSEMPVTLSPRGLGTICGIMECNLPLREAINMVFVAKLSEDGHKSLAQEQLRTVM